MNNIKRKHNEFILNGTVHSIETQGVHVNVIDYSLSRLEIGQSKTKLFLFLSLVQIVCPCDLFSKHKSHKLTNYLL